MEEKREIAKKRQDELEKSMATMVSQSTQTNQAQIALFSLEAAAQSYRKIVLSHVSRMALRPASDAKAPPVSASAAVDELQCAWQARRIVLGRRERVGAREGE